MAKNEKSKEVATQTAQAVVPSYGDNYAGAGWDNTDTRDFQIPFLNQLQQMSPQCVDGGTGFIKEARPGMFFNSVTQELYPGDVCLLVALTKHSFVEWKPQTSGGGFVAEHALESEVVKVARESAKDPLDLRTPAGNELVETYQMFCLVLAGVDSTEVKDQVVVSFSKTKIKRYKQIMTRLRTFKNSARIPLFAYRLKMLSTQEKNPAGQPYKNVSLVPAINNDVGQSLLPADSPLLEIANALREAIAQGAARANFESAAAPGAGGGKDEDADQVFDTSTKGKGGKGK